MHDELEEYQPHRNRPRRRQVMMRAMVWLVVAALVLPGILIAANTAAATANRSCAAYVASLGVPVFSARFEWFTPAGTGWHCFAVQEDREILVWLMGLIPGGPPAEPRTPLQQS
ncbi:MAG: hypothetical protein ABWX59_07070 [Microbacteriaceae bacterium]